MKNFTCIFWGCGGVVVGVGVYGVYILCIYNIYQYIECVYIYYVYSNIYIQHIHLGQKLFSLSNYRFDLQIGIYFTWWDSPGLFKKMKKSRKKRKKIKKILNIFELLKAFVLKGLRLLESCQKLKNKKYLKKMLA